MPNLMELPPWATEAGETPRGARKVDVDADAAIEAVLDDYREHYAEDKNIPGEWKKADGDLRAEWADALDELSADNAEVSCYWLEVAYQTAKMDLVAALGWGLAIHMHASPEKPYAQSKHPEGRPVEKAVGGLDGAKEARHHYKRLRGFFPG